MSPKFYRGDLVKMKVANVKKYYGQKFYAEMKSRGFDGRSIGSVVSVDRYGRVKTKFIDKNKRYIQVSLPGESFSLKQAAPRHPLTSIFADLK